MNTSSYRKRPLSVSSEQTDFESAMSDHRKATRKTLLNRSLRGKLDIMDAVMDHAKERYKAIAHQANVEKSDELEEPFQAMMKVYKKLQVALWSIAAHPVSSGGDC